MFNSRLRSMKLMQLYAEKRMLEKLLKRKLPKGILQLAKDQILVINIFINYRREFKEVPRLGMERIITIWNDSKNGKSSQKLWD